MITSSEIRAVAALAGRPVWDGHSVSQIGLTAAKREQLAIPILALQTPPVFTDEAIRSVLALHHGHALSRLAPNWGFQLTEPQATYGLAHMLEGRPARLRGLLKGLQIAATEEELAQATIVAEEERVDLLIRMGDRAIIVEAKFGHHVTDRQLSSYWKKISPTAKNTKGVLLLIDPEGAPELHYKQKEHWRVVSWVEALLGLDRAAKDDTSDDDDYRLFRRLLWERIGGLTMRKQQL